MNGFEVNTKTNKMIISTEAFFDKNKLIVENNDYTLATIKSKNKLIYALIALIILAVFAFIISQYEFINSHLKEIVIFTAPYSLFFTFCCF